MATGCGVLMAEVEKNRGRSVLYPLVMFGTHRPERRSNREVVWDSLRCT